MKLLTVLRINIGRQVKKNTTTTASTTLVTFLSCSCNASPASANGARNLSLNEYKGERGSLSVFYLFLLFLSSNLFLPFLPSNVKIVLHLLLPTTRPSIHEGIIQIFVLRGHVPHRKVFCIVLSDILARGLHKIQRTTGSRVGMPQSRQSQLIF